MAPFHFSSTSKARLLTAASELQTLFNALLQDVDLAILEGHRDQATQDLYFATGKSKVRWPNGKHCTVPSEAIDACPCINGKATFDHALCVDFGWLVLAKARELGIALRWGGDWDGDGDRSDQSFDDLVHFELKHR